MLLVVNMGNTRTHALCYRGAEPGERLTTSTVFEPGEYSNWLRQVSDAPRRILLASVVPSAAQAFQIAAAQSWGIPTEIIEPRRDLGLSFAPGVGIQELGADLFVNAVASSHDYGGSLLNVDLGTASTFCLIKEGRYLGTSIVPGMELSVRAMIAGTALLKDFALVKMEKVIQDNTTACLQSGIYFGYFELVRGLIERIQKEAGPLRVVLTGGIGTFLYEELAPYVDHFRPDLTLEGLRLIADLLPPAN